MASETAARRLRIVLFIGYGILDD
jgi:hypothetical protein